MLNLTIPVPNVPGPQDIEIEMKINDRKQRLRYRIEVVPWSECQNLTGDRIECIRDLLKAYSDEWVIYHIGMPTDHYVPLTFINKYDWAAQHEWLWSEV